MKVGSDESMAQAQQMFGSLFRDVVGDDVQHAPTTRDMQSMLTTEETLNYWTEPGKDEAVSDSPNSKFYQFRLVNCAFFMISYEYNGRLHTQ